MGALSNRVDGVEIEPLAEMVFRFALMMDLSMAIRTASKINSMGAMTVEKEEEVRAQDMGAAMEVAKMQEKLHEMRMEGR